MQVTLLINIRPPCLAATGNSPLAAKVPFTWLTEHTPNQSLRMTGFGGDNLPLVALAILGRTREGERQNSELYYSYRERERELRTQNFITVTEREGKKKRTQNFITVTGRERELRTLLQLQRERTLNSELYYSYRKRTQNSELYYSYREREGKKKRTQNFITVTGRERELRTLLQLQRERTLNSELYYSYRKRTQNFITVTEGERTQKFITVTERERENDNTVSTKYQQAHGLYGPVSLKPHGSNSLVLPTTAWSI